ncbi:MAG: zinc ribbon domain-containing protein [Eubacteriales bacterium]|jgi:hypothetical protein
MYCPNCGKKIEDDSIFCEYCGAQVADTENTTGNSRNAQDSGYPGEAPAEYGYIPEQPDQHEVNTGEIEGTRIYSGTGESRYASDGNTGSFNGDRSFPPADDIYGESGQRGDTNRPSGGHPLLPVIISLAVGICAAIVLFLIFSGDLHLPGKESRSSSSAVSETAASVSAAGSAGDSTSAGSSATDSSSAKTKSFDAFDGVTVNFSGYDGLGTAAVSGQATDGLTYTLSTAQALSNGDTVTLTVKSPDDSDGTFTAYTKKTGKKPEALTKDFTVSGLTPNLTKLSQIPQDEISNLDSHCKDLRRAEVQNTWNTNPTSNVHETMNSMTLLGEYLLASKTAGNDNHLYLVYRINYSSDLRSATDYYYTFRFDNITIGSDGSISIPNAANPVTPDDSQRVTMDSVGHYVTGYSTKDAFYNAVIAPQSSAYTVTGNIS